jgi:agmatinase
MKTSFKTLNPQQNFLGIDEEFSMFDSSKVTIVPAPYEHSTTRGAGTTAAPQAILKASRDVELFDEETKREICKEQGIATIPPLNVAQKKEESALQEIHGTVSSLINLNKFVVTLGGEHTISSAVIAAFAKKYDSLSVLQFDAHANLRDQHPGNQYSNSSVMARVCEFLDPTKLVQVGVRSLCKQEAEFVRDHAVNVFYAHEIRGGTYTRMFKYWDDAVVERLTDNVYITFDVDAFDPSIMPATAAPEPGGLFWVEVMRCLRKVGQKRTIVGFDVVELAPNKTLRFPDLAAARLVSKMLNYAL